MTVSLPQTTVPVRRSVGWILSKARQAPAGNDYRLVEQDNFLLVDGQHDGIISESHWNDVQVKLKAQSEKYEHINRWKNKKVHLLSDILKCLVCGAGMYGNKSTKRKPDGSKYKDFSTTAVNIAQ